MVQITPRTHPARNTRTWTQTAQTRDPHHAPDAIPIIASPTASSPSLLPRSPPARPPAAPRSPPPSPPSLLQSRRQGRALAPLPPPQAPVSGASFHLRPAVAVPPRSSAAASSRPARALVPLNAVWAFFLPRNLPPLADGEVPTAPRKKDLFLRLSDSPVLLSDNFVSTWLDRETGAKCYMLFARDLLIVWGWATCPSTGAGSLSPTLDCTNHCTPPIVIGLIVLSCCGLTRPVVIELCKKLLSCHRQCLDILSGSCFLHMKKIVLIYELSRLSEGAQLVSVCWFEIRGKIHNKMQSEDIVYAAYIVFKLNEHFHGLNYPIQVANDDDQLVVMCNV